MRRLWLVALLTALFVVPQPAQAAPVHYDQPGPFAVVSEPLDATHTVFRPADLGGGKHAVIVWGNGTGAVPAVYAGLLRHLASYGFVVAAADTVNSGTGVEMLDGARTLVAENARPGSAYFGRIDTAHIGATGHSQGGGGAIAAGADPLVTTTVPIEPGPLGSVAALRGPVLFLGGQSDVVVPPALLVIPRYYAASQVPAVYGELAGATHFTPAGDGGGFRGAITAWFRYWLAGDEQARGVFFGPGCTLCADPAWSQVLRNAKALEV
ncbi:acetylxylan esterase [Amycolatopsis sp. NBC_01488]|uniref:poly(ethylene terephthalate) hydrolase family protein n=1 Tax=Amycolatopsis sp. NBC_01488 TaxID=2903563 RepID=UPI002E2B79CF|nr:acetylxylan esterase [Amycolatopsis sp. NBC_01488]